MYPAGGSGPPLEDHLRNLILNNAEGGAGHLNPESGPPIAPPIPSASASAPLQPPGPPGAPHVSPQFMGSGSMPPYQTPMPMPTAAAGPAPMGPVPSSPRASRKRPNQAQRRQMSAQLSIPIDPHPRPQQPPHSARQYVSPPAYTNQSYPTSYHGAQRPQSATFRPTHHTHASSVGPPPGLSFPPHPPPYPRHQQSLSFNGPIPYNEQSDWRSPQFGRHGDPYHPGGHPSQVPALPFDAPSPRSTRNPNASLYNPGPQYHVRPSELAAQCEHLEALCQEIIANAEIEPADIREKEDFRAKIELVCRDAIAQFERECNGISDFPAASVQLKCFGSLASGFATKASDMDLALLSPFSRHQPDSQGSHIPRLVEKAFLDAGLGARLLTRTRVPIIKLCEKPTQSLRTDLLHERAKWEKGVPDEPDAMDADEDDPDAAAAAAAAHDGTPAGETKMPGHNRDESGPVGELDDEKYEKMLATLKQPDRQSLPNYYLSAKRLLRKVGGRDITHATARDFKAQDFKILTDVSRAFVCGLADEALKTRLTSKVSLAFSSTSSLPTFRSLAGVYTQVEGERLAMIWATRELQEKDEYHDKEAKDRVKFWSEVQNRPSFGLDLLAYNKELQLSAESLKGIPSIQIVILEQGQYESSSLYHSRAIKLLVDLGGSDAPSPANTILPVVVRQYVLGIFNESIRSQVDEFVRSTDSVSLRAAARRHKSLQLAHEFEKALEKGFYEGKDLDDIKEYIDVLRSPLSKTSGSGEHFDYVVPCTTVVSRIGHLKDPARLAPNQPRDPYRDRLEFPSTGVGVQCDINFSAHLALQNTLLLRCYSHTDSRVRPLVLFIKHWAKVRGINSPYRGTLSSYGYVLMVLHYLVNIAHPFVCPNLQQPIRPPPANLAPEQVEEIMFCKGRNVQFWRDEAELDMLARKGVLNQNRDSIGHLLRGFFEYFAHNGHMSTVPCRGFDWGRDVLSLRTPGGIRSKQEKGWTGAKTIIEVQRPGPHPDAGDSGAQQAGGGGDSSKPMAPPKGQLEVKEVRHRYLVAIEDPFELDHNVARTVTHNGIVSIRDEFRRAWRIIRNVQRPVEKENLLLDAAAEKEKGRDAFAELLDEIHGLSGLAE